MDISITCGNSTMLGNTSNFDTDQGISCIANTKTEGAIETSKQIPDKLMLYSVSQVKFFKVIIMFLMIFLPLKL